MSRLAMSDLGMKSLANGIMEMDSISNEVVDGFR